MENIRTTHNYFDPNEQVPRIAEEVQTKPELMSLVQESIRSERLGNAIATQLQPGMVSLISNSIVVAKAE